MTVTPDTTTTKIDQEHAELRRLIDSINQSLSGAVAEGTVQSIDRFAQLLRSHFGNEEAADGFYTQIEAQDTRFVLPIQNLQAEHKAMLGQVEHLRTLAETANWDAARSVFASLSETLHEHETQENLLMQQAYSEDIGSKD